MFDRSIKLVISIALFLLPATSFAQSLGTCTNGVCQCTSQELDDYDSCTVTNKVVDTLDPDQVRSATNLTYSANGGEVLVETDIDGALGTVILVNGYDGDWPSLSALAGYLGDLMDLPTTPDLCYDLPGMLVAGYHQTGLIARWDPSTGTWANDQTQNVVLAAITDGDGDLFIDGVQVMSARVATGTSCVTDSDGPLDATTCATVKSQTINFEDFCNEGPLIEPQTYYVAEGEQKDVKWNGKTTVLDYSGSLSQGTLEFEFKEVLADSIEVDANFYDGGSFSLADSESDVNENYVNVSQDGDGICVWGAADRADGVLNRAVNGDVIAGTAPSSCSGE